jgi:hypothetical protein
MWIYYWTAVYIVNTVEGNSSSDPVFVKPGIDSQPDDNPIRRTGPL